MKKTALVIGATGATGSDLVSQLLEEEEFDKVHIFVRRDPCVHHEKLEIHIIDFDKLEEWKDLLKGDVLFSALGTTIKKAGSQQAQWKIDYTYQYEVARAAKANGVDVMCLVSSAWSTSKSRMFYTRMKGQLEDDVKKIGFRSLSIMRPPSLIRKDSDRFGERISISLLKALNNLGVLRDIRPMPTSQVAHAMIVMAKQNKDGAFTLNPTDLWKL